MSVRTDKEKIIREIMNLRTLVNEVDLQKKKNVISYFLANRKNADKILEIYRHINKIHDMIFNI